MKNNKHMTSAELAAAIQQNGLRVSRVAGDHSVTFVHDEAQLDQAIQELGGSSIHLSGIWGIHSCYYNAAAIAALKQRIGWLPRKSTPVAPMPPLAQEPWLRTLLQNRKPHHILVESGFCYFMMYTAMKVAGYFAKRFSKNPRTQSRIIREAEGESGHWCVRGIV